MGQRYKSMELAESAWERGEIEGDKDYFPGYPQGSIGFNCPNCHRNEVFVGPESDTGRMLCEHCWEYYNGLVYDVHIPDKDGAVPTILIYRGYADEKGEMHYKKR